MNQKTILLLSFLLLNSATAGEYYSVIKSNSILNSITVNKTQAPLLPESPYTEHTLVKTDWLSVGDSAATLDTKTGLEWLDFSRTKGYPYSTNLTGWRKPTYLEIKELIQNSFPITSLYENQNGILYGNQHYDKNITNAELLRWHDFFGTTNTTWSAGLFLDKGILRYIGVDYFQNIVFGVNNQTDVNHLLSGNNAYGVIFVSDGNTTLSSKNNSNINIPVIK